MFNAFVFLAVITIVSAQNCALTGAAPGEATGDSTDAFCGWYEDDSCCPNFIDVYPIFEASNGLSLRYGYECAEKLGLMYCATCSPSFGLEQTEKTLCLDFVTELWQACKNVNGFCVVDNEIDDDENPDKKGCTYNNANGFKVFPAADYTMKDYFNISTFYSEFLYPTFGTGGEPWQILSQPSYELLDNADGCFNSGSSYAASFALVASMAALVITMF
eukprot:c961_g1_i1.p1 GENE.c961_g1_i1~~c961_g1_i1.p1  ORF type:complete len:218 (-),score=12.83 c961_g1_i1:43-696(-)